MKSVKFEDMSVRTLASLFVDCLDDRNNMIADSCVHIANGIMAYMTINRTDDLDMFLSFVNQQKTMRLLNQ